MRKKTAKDHLFGYLDTLKAGHTYVLSGWELFDRMNAITGKKTTPATLVKYLREYSAITGTTCKYTGKEQKYWFIPSGVHYGGLLLRVNGK